MASIKKQMSMNGCKTILMEINDYERGGGTFILFSADATILSKDISNSFFAHENMKKPPSKVAHNRPRPFFSVLFYNDFVSNR